MKIGDEVTWGKRARNSINRNKPTLFITGVIIGGRVSKKIKKREFEICVRWYSGNLPDHPKSIQWITESEILYGKCAAKKHVSKVSPMGLLRSRLKAEQTKIEKEANAGIWKSKRDIGDSKKAA